MKLITAGLAVLIVATLLLGWTQPARAEPRLTVFVCRGIQITDLFAYGKRADPVGCARSFSASTPYVILYARVENVDSDFTFNWELTDPTGEVYARYGFSESPSRGHTWNYSIWHVLPVAATPDEIVRQNPGFRDRLIEVGAVPVSQKTGEWRLKVAMRPGFTVTQKFTIEP
jgi:hypothetical protein